jgi:hypothetical protein
VGHWQDDEVLARLDVRLRAAAAGHDAQGAKFARFGDNMREVAVTEGNKVSAQMKFGYSVSGYGVGDLAAYVKVVSDTAVSNLILSAPGTFLTQKSAKELLLIITGDSLEELTQDGVFLTGLIQQEVENALPCTVTIGADSPYQRLMEISQSFAEALTQVKNAGAGAN